MQYSYIKYIRYNLELEDTAKKLILKLVEDIQLRNSAKQEHS